MDYANIYSDFIASRRKTEKGLVKSKAYRERHHVVPVAVGGSNEPANLIYLTARDHYFAHCCLAKIHGGKMWSALFAMANMTKTSGSASYFLRGRLVEVARREAALVRSENMTELWGSGAFKRNRVYESKPEEFKAMMRLKMTGRVHRPESIEKQRASRNAAAQKFEFSKVESGETYVGTCFDFRHHSGVSQPMASYLCNGKIKSASGWVLRGTDPRSILGRNTSVLTFGNVDGSVFTGTRREFITKFKLDAGVISNLINGKNRVKSFKGWTIKSPENGQG